MTTPERATGRPPLTHELNAGLVAAACDGDEAAFETLIRAHQDRLYAVALRMTGNVHDAEDVVQEALVQAWQHLPTFRQDAALGTWLVRIVINRCHNLRRRPAPVAELPREQALDHDVEHIVEGRRRRDHVAAAIAELPFEQRAALVLHTFDGRSHAEVAQLLGCTQGAVKVRIHRARRALLDRLGDWR